MRDIIGVVGAGTMGAGIAQVAAIAGHSVYVYDSVPGSAQRAVAGVRARVSSLVAKGKLGLAAERVTLVAVDSLSELSRARTVVEAIVEDLAAKQRLLANLEEIVTADCMLASNTSSLSPTALAAPLRHPERFVGMHFFNPVPVMRLVEVVLGLATSPDVADAATALATSWGKTVVRSAATPGFIVNRVARPFYGEAWRLYEEHAADAATVDAVMVGAGGFQMGPFALMDLIGHDVNEAVTRSVWTDFGYDPRFAPSIAQRTLVEARWLGRKTERGVYDYRGGASALTANAMPKAGAPVEVVEHGNSGLGALLARSRVPVRAGDANQRLIELPSGALLARCRGVTASELAARHGAPVVLADRTNDDATATAVAIAASPDCPVNGRDEAVGLLQAGGLDVYLIEDTPGLIVTRTVAMLVNVATDAMQQGVAAATEIDAAMRLGTNYPIGPLEWGRRWGLDSVLGVLDELESYYRDSRYRACALLRRTAASGTKRA
jgi:3-hydroxybutyryl-CoA dehydrogenase